MTRAALVALALAACGDPPITIKYALTRGPSEICTASDGSPAQSCSDVSIPCKAVLNIRILSPTDPTEPYVSLCEPIDGRKDLCSIAGIDLPPDVEIPAQTLEVQVAVYADSVLQHDVMGNPICDPTTLAYTPQGLPVEQPSSPAIGGRAFYHPGDSTTVVELGCNDLAELQNPTCTGANSVAVTASVDDFDTGLSVSGGASGLAQELSVLVGEPAPMGPDYVLNPTDETPLDETSDNPPAWGASVDRVFESTVCVEVLEDGAQMTPTLSCTSLAAPDPMMLQLTGVRLAKSTLDGVLGALMANQFPPQGLVIGIVRDKNLAPVANIMVAASDMSAVQYLTADGAHLQGTSTSSLGIFVDKDASYGTTFTALDGTVAPPTGLGGNVDGKVTAVVLQLGSSGTH
ncbi:MAG TPA: hypothetical protein VLX92_01310 [Kofleriaceae bacterium]|nr:hypothetical protein [Kofleriaceae bacterium]